MTPISSDMVRSSLLDQQSSKAGSRSQSRIKSTFYKPISGSNTERTFKENDASEVIEKGGGSLDGDDNSSDEPGKSNVHSSLSAPASGRLMQSKRITNTIDETNGRSNEQLIHGEERPKDGPGTQSLEVRQNRGNVSDSLNTALVEGTITNQQRSSFGDRKSLSNENDDEVGSVRKTLRAIGNYI